MKPIDFRNETFKSLHSQLNVMRMAVYNAWVKHGPGTTREVAARSGIDILTFRPRTTELYQMGFVTVHGEGSGRRGSTALPGEGVYRAVTSEEEWRGHHAREDCAVCCQQQLL